MMKRKSPEGHNYPDNWKDIVLQCSTISPDGHYASVALANSEQKFDSKDEEAVPLWRGASMYIQFPGLE